MENPRLDLQRYSISEPIAPAANPGGGEPPAKLLADWQHTLPYRPAGFLFVSILKAIPKQHV